MVCACLGFLRFFPVELETPAFDPNWVVWGRGNLELEVAALN